MIKKKLNSLLLVCFLLASCAGTDPKTNEKVGSATGAIIGAVIGSKIGGSMDSRSGRILGASLGAIFGSIIGKEIAKTLSETDLRRSDETAQETMESAKTGDTVKWSNPDSGNSGTYKATSDRQPGEDQDCREFESTVIIDGQEKVATGRACRQADGSWKIAP